METITSISLEEFIKRAQSCELLSSDGYPGHLHLAKELDGDKWNLDDYNNESFEYLVYGGYVNDEYGNDDDEDDDNYTYIPLKDNQDIPYDPQTGIYTLNAGVFRYSFSNGTWALTGSRPVHVTLYTVAKF